MRQPHLGVILALGLGLASACRVPEPPVNGGPTGQTAKPAPSGGRVVIGMVADVAGLNPLLSVDPQSTTVSRRIYSSLVTNNPMTGDVEPFLAESWSTPSDALSVTFVLRENLVWSDGSPLTVDDALFTLSALLRSPTATRRSDAMTQIVGGQDYAEGKTQTLEGVTTSGRTLTVRLTSPLCTAVGDFGGLPILPRSVFGKYLDPADASRTIDAAPENAAPPLSSGPFRFQEWVPRDHVTLVRNDNFFLGTPGLDEWVYRVVPSQPSIPAALQTGELDMAQVSGAVAANLEATGAFQVFSTPGTGYWYIAWNQLRTGKEFFRDKAVRQALTYGLDWDEIVATQLQGHGQRVAAHTPPSSWAYDPSGLNMYPYDPQKARQLLEIDGWVSDADGIYQKAGQRLAFTLTTNSENSLRGAIVQIAAEQYRKIGVEATPRTEAFESFLARTINSKDSTYGDQGGRDIDAYLLGWGQIGPDPDAYWYWHSSQLQTGGNRVGYTNVIVDRALEDGRRLCTPADRKAAYHRMDLQLNEDQPVSFGFVGDTVIAVSKHIQGVEPGPYSFLAQWNVQQWRRVP